ncbi:MAG: diguanylate cyclase [Oscillospiraceae bacterium]
MGFGRKVYGSLDENADLDLLKQELTIFLDMDQDEVIQEKTIETKEGVRTYSIKFKKMMDVSEKNGGTVIIFNDITERLKIENELKQQYEMLERYAEPDPMTGVLNRRMGIVKLEKELVRSGTGSSPMSVGFIDIDGLKEVNDTYGHMEGDLLIISTALAAEAVIREGDMISRMGGDEFLIVFPDCTEEVAEKIVRSIIDEINESDEMSGKPYKHSFSYGIVTLPMGAQSNANDVILAADQKMCLNKMSKKSVSCGQRDAGAAALAPGDRE